LDLNLIKTNKPSQPFNSKEDAFEGMSKTPRARGLTDPTETPGTATKNTA